MSGGKDKNSGDIGARLEELRELMTVHASEYQKRVLDFAREFGNDDFIDEAVSLVHEIVVLFGGFKLGDISFQDYAERAAAIAKKLLAVARRVLAWYRESKAV